MPSRGLSLLVAATPLPAPSDCGDEALGAGGVGGGRALVLWGDVGEEILTTT